MYIELSSSTLGSQILSCSDEFFAPASSLLLPHDPKSLKGQYGPNGALYDGWETRRHNPTFDWAIIKLACLGQIEKFVLDTTHFSGNEAPAAEVWGLRISDEEAEREDVRENDERWMQLLPCSPLGPSAVHTFQISPSEPVNLLMIPDGGLSRLRAIGRVIPPAFQPGWKGELASVLLGATIVEESDRHFGAGENILKPGRGFDMSDGWETRRSRVVGKKDWVVVRLATPGYVDWVEIDTKNFIGNFPESAEVLGAYSDGQDPPATSEELWTPLVARTKLGPDARACFALEPSLKEKRFSHVKLVIYPEDGGVKRLRIHGRVSLDGSAAELPIDGSGTQSQLPTSALNKLSIPALPISPLTYSPYGKVLQSYTSPDLAPPSIRKTATSANFGTAIKYNNLADLEFLPAPGEQKVVPNLCIFKANKWEGRRLKALERHSLSTQVFSPLGASEGTNYLVVVALNGADDKPDLKTLKAFVASGKQGITYRPGVWHHPLLAIDADMDFTCIVAETGVKELDCELVEFDRLGVEVEVEDVKLD
ncbi:Allantoicase [Atractiella rhizophila]|nr:Allantoicase [Atractiella rhizophila]